MPDLVPARLLVADDDERARSLPKRELVCAACGYGILRATPPARCPMCQAESAWTVAPARLTIPVH
jgi:rubrerythrin